MQRDYAGASPAEYSNFHTTTFSAAQTLTFQGRVSTLETVAAETFREKIC